ncbi:MAG: Gfo/Idh/MocA family oxidoreductase, partial [Clostridia bacterium]
MSDAVLSNFTPTVHEERSFARKLKVAIIGTGWIAEAHIESYKNMPDVEVVAMADLVPGKAEAFAKRYGVEGVRLYPNHTALLAAEKDLDAVSVCTYNRTHAECAIDALRAGVNVLLEKPMCVTIEEAAQIVRAEKASGKLLSIGFQPRMDPNMQMIKKIVNSGALGEIYYIQTGGGRRRGIPNSTFIEQDTAGIGALGDIGCYSLDMVLNAIGYPKPLTVTGYTSNFFGTNVETQYADAAHTAAENAARFNVDDFAAAFIRLEGGVILDFRISWAMHLDTPGDTVILGKKGA